jgi:hypothetical protein
MVSARLTTTIFMITGFVVRRRKNPVPFLHAGVIKNDHTVKSTPTDTDRTVVPNSATVQENPELDDSTGSSEEVVRFDAKKAEAKDAPTSPSETYQ